MKTEYVISYYLEDIDQKFTRSFSSEAEARAKLQQLKQRTDAYDIHLDAITRIV